MNTAVEVSQFRCLRPKPRRVLVKKSSGPGRLVYVLGLPIRIQARSRLLDSNRHSFGVLWTHARLLGSANHRFDAKLHISFGGRPIRDVLHLAGPATQSRHTEPLAQAFTSPWI